MSVINIRIDDDLHQAFLTRCKSLDTTVSQELRRYIRSYLAEQVQTDLPLADKTLQKPARTPKKRRAPARATSPKA